MIKSLEASLLVLSFLFLHSSTAFSVNEYSLDSLYKKFNSHKIINQDSAQHYLHLIRKTSESDINKNLRAYIKTMEYFRKYQVNIDSAFHYSDYAAIEIIKNTDNPATIARFLTDKGFLHSKFNDYKGAVYWLKKSIDYKSKIPDLMTDKLSRSYNLIGQAYRKLGLYEESRIFLKKALTLSTKKRAAALTYKNLGILLTDQDSLPEAKKMFFKAIDIYNEVDSTSVLVLYCKKNLARVFIKSGDYKRAIELLEECENSLKIRTNNTEFAVTHRLLSESHFNLQEIKKAEFYARKSLVRARKLNIPHHIIEAINCLVPILELNKDFEEINLLRKEKERNQDVISLAEAKLQVLSKDLEQKFDAVVKNKEQENSNLKQEKNTLSLYLIIFFLLSVVLIIWLRKYFKNREVVFSKKIQIEKQKKIHINQKLQLQKKHTRQLETELQNSISLLSEYSDKGVAVDNKLAIDKLYNHRLLTEKDWSLFKVLFLKIHPSFFDQLKKQNNKLTPTDLKVVALIRLNLENTEIAHMLAVSPESVRKAKYRLRQKLELSNNNDLQSFVFSH